MRRADSIVNQGTPWPCHRLAGIRFARVKLILAAEGLVALGFRVKRAMLKNGERYIGLATTLRPTRWVPRGPKLGGLDRLLEMLEASWMVNVATVHTALSLFIGSGFCGDPACGCRMRSSRSAA